MSMPLHITLCVYLNIKERFPERDYQLLVGVIELIMCTWILVATANGPASLVKDATSLEKLFLSGLVNHFSLPVLPGPWSCRTGRGRWWLVQQQLSLVAEGESRFSEARAAAQFSALDNTHRLSWLITVCVILEFLNPALEEKDFTTQHLLKMHFDR